MKKRVAHKLAANPASTRPQFVIFVDTETDIVPLDERITEYPFKLGVAHYWRRRRDGREDKHEWFSFSQVGAFWDWVEQRTTPRSVLYLVAHNLIFDLVTLDFLHQLPRRGWKLVYSFDKDKTALQKWRKDGKTIFALNNTNIFRGKLADWGERVGLPKVEVNFHHASREQLKAHCQRDVEIVVALWEWWLDFLDKENLGTFKPTIASQSLAAWRHRFYNHPIYIHNNADVLKLERRALKGGRTECFRVGRFTDGPYYKLDVNSMYPYMMKGRDYPNGLRMHGKGISPAAFARLLGEYGAIADVEIDTAEPWFPVARGENNVYPVGRFKTTLTTPELLLALHRGWIREVGEFAIYAMRPLFYRFVEELYPLKVEAERCGDNMKRKLIKLLLVSLYGKFGQRGMNEQVVGRCDPGVFKVEDAIDCETGETYQYRYQGGQVTRVTRSGEGFNSFPAIAAHVTAEARLYLYEFMQLVGREHCLYIDTDCLIVDQVGYDSLQGAIDPHSLGWLKLEETANSVEIRAAKDYTISAITRLKGIPQDADWLDDSSAEFEMWPGLATLIREGVKTPYRTVKCVRSLARSVATGHIDQDGFVHPYRYPEDR